MFLNIDIILFQALLLQTNEEMEMQVLDLEQISLRTFEINEKKMGVYTYLCAFIR